MSFEYVLRNEVAMKRMSTLEQNIIAALNAETEEERTKWRGDLQGYTQYVVMICLQYLIREWKWNVLLLVLLVN